MFLTHLIYVLESPDRVHKQFLCLVEVSVNSDFFILELRGLAGEHRILVPPGGHCQIVERHPPQSVRRFHLQHFSVLPFCIRIILHQQVSVPQQHSDVFFVVYWQVVDLTLGKQRFTQLDGLRKFTITFSTLWFSWWIMRFW